MTNGLFQGEKDGILSMRRVLAFLFALSCICSCIMGMIFAADWKITLVCGGLCGVLSCIMMFFTTWEDVSKVVSFKKEK